MSSLLDEVAAQLSRELGALAWDLGTLASLDDAMTWQLRMQRAADRLARQAMSPDDNEAADTVQAILGVLWPVPPEDVDRADWWNTPLGRICARSLGRSDSEAVSHSVAAAMLGITKGSIPHRLDNGQLDRHPDGGVLRASVLQRIAERD